MEQIISVAGWALENWQMLLAAIAALAVAAVGLLHAAIAVALVIPGPEPEGTLQKVADKISGVAAWLARFSRK